MRDTTLDSRAELDISTQFMGINQIRQVGERVTFSRYSTIVTRLKTMNDKNLSYQNPFGFNPNLIANDLFKFANDREVVSYPPAACAA